MTRESNIVHELESILERLREARPKVQRIHPDAAMAMGSACLALDTWRGELLRTPSPSPSDEERARRWLAGTTHRELIHHEHVPSLASEFAAVAEAARVEEREACAAECDAQMADWESIANKVGNEADVRWAGIAAEASRCATRIRARGRR